MRFTLDPGGDLEVAAGSVLGTCREAFARLSGSRDLVDAVLTVDGQPLADDHVAGAPPWVAGSTVRVGPGDPDPRALALTAPWHLAVVAGPDAGTVAVPGRDGVIRVGRHVTGEGGRAHLTLTDPAVSRVHVQIKMLRRRRRVRWVVDDLGSANGTELTGGGRRGGRRRAVRHRRRVLHPSEVITVGSTTLLPRPSPLAGGAGRGAAPGATGGDGSHAVPDEATRQGGMATGGSWVTAAAGSLALAVMTRNPVFLVLVLAGPVGLALPQLVRRLRRRARAPRQRSAGLGSGVPAGGSPGPRGGRGRSDGQQPAQPRLPGAAVPTGRREAVWSLGPDAAWSGVHLAAQLGTRAGGDRGLRHALPWWGLAQEGLAVVGARPDVLAVVRGAVGAALLDPELDVALLAGHTASDAPAMAGVHPPEAGAPPSDVRCPDPGWLWLRWLDPRRGSGVAMTPADAPHVLSGTRPGGLVLADGSSRWRRALHVWWMTGRHEDDALLVLDEDRGAVPPWCRWVLVVAPDGSATLSGDGEHRPVLVPAAPSGWLEDHARLAAARDARQDGATAGRSGPAHGDGGMGVRVSEGVLPDRVALADLRLPAGTAEVRRAWSRTATRAMPGLTATLGVGVQGHPVGVDLLAEGPHMLVAGTTGAGKSELLQSLVLSLALRYPPTELAVVLVDYKGGASFGRCRELPHVVGEVTDLDQVEAARALDGVRAELHRRERLLADAGVGDLESLRSLADRRRAEGRQPPPRLLVVVDEFRALTEDLPDFVPGLVRIASQGRSLGIHLVLATQRPSGAVSGQLRANMALRLCLRVTDAADSSDVVDVGDAAALPVDRPGRAVLRRGAGRPEAIQTAWAALPPGAWTPPPVPGGHSVRWAPRWPVPLGRQHDTETEEGPDHTAEMVHAMCEAAAADGIERPADIWLPPLPTAVPPELLRGHCATDRGHGFPLALLDLPSRQARGVLRWDGRSGALAVGGRPGSGRTAVLMAAAHGALAAGWHLHVVTGAPRHVVTTPPQVSVRPLEHHDEGTGALGVHAPWGASQSLGHSGVGTVVGAEDARRVAHLLTAMLATRPEPTLLLIDDIGVVWRALERLPRGAAADLLERVVREGRQRGVAVAFAGAPTDLTRLLPHAAERLVLAVADPHDDVLMGVPHGLAGGRDVPGRAVHLGAAGALRCQVASPVPGLGRGAARAHGDLVRTQPLRLEPVPLQVRRSGLPTGEGWLLAVGRGGDDAGPVVLDASCGALVVGPAGSGRSTALATMVLALRATGRHPLVVARSGPLATVGFLDPARHGSGSTALALLETLDGGPGGSGPPLAGDPGVAVVDDLDVLAGTDPALDDLLRRWATAAEAGDLRAPRVIGSARTDRAAAAYRGAVAALRSSSPVVVLSPAAPGSAEVAGTDLSLAVDVTSPHRPGAGVLVHRGPPTCLQVAH